MFGCGEATPVAEGSCADPLALSLPAYLRGSAFLHPDESGVNCPVGTLSAERFAYAVEVPAGETLRARLTTWLLGGFFPEFWIGPSCDVAYPCVDGINFSPEIEVKTIEWPNGTGRAVTMIVGGAAIHSSTYELQIELVSEASTCGPACELGEACVEGVCTSIVDSCPLPRVTFPDGACGSPAFTTAACDCGAACAAGESCLDGACLASPPGESCASPLDRGAGLPPQVATSVTVEAADGPVIASPFGGTTHAVDATIRFDAGAFGCRDLTVLADPESAVTAGRPLDAWLLVELFDDQPCSGAPLASQLFVPQWGPYDSPNLFTLPEGLAGPVRLRASWVALDDQGPIVVSVAHHPLACL